MRKKMKKKNIDYESKNATLKEAQKYMKEFPREYRTLLG